MSLCTWSPTALLLKFLKYEPMIFIYDVFRSIPHTYAKFERVILEGSVMN